MIAITTGETVRFHPIIGLKHDGHIYTVRCIGTLYGEPVAWLYGKPACVTVAALSRCESITCPRVAQAGGDQ